MFLSRRRSFFAFTFVVAGFAFAAGADEDPVNPPDADAVLFERRSGDGSASDGAGNVLRSLIT